MNQFERQFAQDCRDKKNIAHGFQHMKNGSKSRKCSLPSDRLTNAQWKRKNGEIMSYKLDEPCTLEEFKAMPNDIQKEYINNLQKLYWATLSMLGEMWGISQSAVCKLLKHLGISMGKNRRLTQLDMEIRDAKWSAFLNGVVGGGTKAEPEPTEEDEPLEAPWDLFEKTMADNDRLSEQIVKAACEPRAFQTANVNISETASGYYDYESMRNWLLLIADKIESVDQLRDMNVTITVNIEGKPVER